MQMNTDHYAYYDARSSQSTETHVIGHIETRSGFERSYDESYKRPKTQIKKQTEIDYDSLVTEDDTPVDNFYCDKQLRLLPESLDNSWDRHAPYIIAADVGIYDYNSVTPIVPDVFLSLDVEYAEQIWQKRNRCYMMNIFQKAPELVIEVVSNKEGGETTNKLQTYASMGIKYYAIFDPMQHILQEKFRTYRLNRGAYVQMSIINKKVWFSDLKIGLTVKHGIYEKMTADWLRWCDNDGKILKSGHESTQFEKKRANTAEQRANFAEKKMNTLEKRVDTAEKQLETQSKRAKKAEELLEAQSKRADAMAQEIERLKAELCKK